MDCEFKKDNLRVWIRRESGCPLNLYCTFGLEAYLLTASFPKEWSAERAASELLANGFEQANTQVVCVRLGEMQITARAAESAQTHWRHSGNAACADFLTPGKLKKNEQYLFPREDAWRKVQLFPCPGRENAPSR